MRFLVIGGAGYIGSHFVREATRQGHSSLIFDNLSRGFRASLPVENEFIEGDLLDSALLTKVMEAGNFDAVYHFAAYALVGESVADPEIYYRNNVEGVKVLLDVLRSMPSPPVLVFSSSCAVFGTPSKVPIAEEDAKNPLSPYGKSKLVNEWMIADYCQAYGLRAMALRYFNACGADLDGGIGEAHDPETHLIPNVLRAALLGEALTIHGGDFETRDGTCERDYIHVTDLAAAHVRAALVLNSKDRAFFDALHLGTGTGYTNLEIVKAAEKVLGQAVTFTVGPRRAGDPAKLFADNTRARSVLGFSPKYSDLDTILRTALVWHKAYPRGFK